MFWGVLGLGVRVVVRLGVGFKVDIRFIVKVEVWVRFTLGQGWGQFWG